MIAGARQPIVAPADLTRFLVAFGLVPLLLVSKGVGLDDPPWSFTLTPTWSIEQLVFIALAGAALGVTSNRSAHGVAAVTLGILLGLAADLWWLAGWVTPQEQTFVTMLPQAEWRSHATGSALVLLGVVDAGFVVGAVIRLLTRDRSGPSLRRPTGAEAVAVGLAVIGGPLLALGIASAGASSALLVPDGAQVQTVRVAAGAITVDPAVLRAGQTRFQCQFRQDSAPVYAYLVPMLEGADAETVSPTFDYHSTCGVGPDTVTWGPIADLQPGRYAWKQIDNQEELPRVIETSQVVVVVP